MRPSIVLGPGERFRSLGAVLGGLGFALRPIHDWADVDQVVAGNRVVILVDAGSTPQEDLGFLRRCLEKNANAQAIALGDDAGTRVARSLLALPRVRWIHWPPDLEEILSITDGLRGTDDDARDDGAQERARDERRPPMRAATQPAQTPATRTGVRDVEADEIGRIQSILEGVDDETEDADVTQGDAGLAAHNTPEELGGVRTPAHGPFDVDEEEAFREIAPLSTREAAPQSTREATPPATREAVPQVSRADAGRSARDDAERAARVLEEPAQSEITTPASNVHERVPDWWRAQVADLANAVQRIELGAQAVRIEALDDEVAEQVDALENEIARLVQFTRTLGYVAAPPARGDQVFDLAEMVQLFVKDLASKAEAPRCLFRAPAHVWVRSDRVLLTQVFDALFWLAGACARTGDLVRAQVRSEGNLAEARLEFPAGPLADLDVERILEPYGLRRVLPDLGPNALAAARGILSGQGGRADLQRSAKGRFEWRIELPAVGAPPNGNSGGSGSGGRPRRAASSSEAD